MNPLCRLSPLEARRDRTFAVTLFPSVCYAFLIVLAMMQSPTVIAAGGIDDTLVRLAPDDLSVVARGEGVYREQCASCHGADLEGQPDWRRRNANGQLPAPPHDASGHTWHHADDLLFEIVKYGPGAVIGDESYDSAMPPYADVLSDEDIVAVLSYIVNSWPDEERDYQGEIDAAQVGSPRPGTTRSTIDDLFK